MSLSIRPLLKKAFGECALCNAQRELFSWDSNLGDRICADCEPFLGAAEIVLEAMYLRKEVGADPIWKYEELPPVALIESLHLEPAVIDQDEFSRAEWFWSRRPKVLSQSLILLLFYITVLVCLFYLGPDTVWFLLLWILAGVSCAFIGHIRLNRWRNEYESSIKGIVVRL